MKTEDLKKAKELSVRVANIGSKYKPVPSIRAYISDAPPPSEGMLRALIEPIVRQFFDSLGAPKAVVTPDFVKEIIATMHALPESEKLEISKGVRNSSSFIFNNKTYGTHEMMHGGASGSSSTTFVTNEIVAGSGTTFTLANTPTAGSVQVYGFGQLLTPGAGNDYTITNAIITTANSFSTGAIVASYRM